MHKARTFFFVCAGLLCLALAYHLGARSAVAQAGCADTTAVADRSTERHFKLGLVLTQTDPETVFNIFRVAQYALQQGDEVSLFLLGKDVELQRIKDPKFDVQGKAQAFAAAGGRILACGTCLQMHGAKGSGFCPVSSLGDLYRIIRASDRVMTF
jgi:tRNA 2-thiouridine synthesizing protein D